MQYIYLATAIILEVIGTTTLKQSEQFSKLIPSLIVVISYSGAFYFLSYTLKTMHVGTVYAIWAGVGIILISTISAILYKQIPDIPAIIGLTFIIIGVIIVNVFSETISH